MYCVKCGVKLKEGTKVCPLCNTPVMIEENIEAIHKSYSEKYPKEQRNVLVLVLGFVSAISLALILSSLIICLNIYGKVSWSGYVMLGIFSVYMIFVFPLWFKKKSPYIFGAIDILVIQGYLLFICLFTKGNWYLSFAFPVGLITGAIVLTCIALYRNLKQAKLFITGGLFVFIGCSMMLVELFDHITFGLDMFVWSLYPVVIFSSIGLFLIISGLIPALRQFLERKFFI